MHCKFSTIFCVIAALGLLAMTVPVKAQQTRINKGFKLGLQLSEYQNDFGTGLSLTSPWFANNNIAVRLRGNVMFHEHIQNQETTWSPYFHFTFGVAGKTGIITDMIELYGEGGVIGLLPNENFSSKSFEFGGYGLFGFEFFMNPGNSYFIEIGAVGTGAKADEVINQPIYSNGLTISAGFRLSL